MYVEHETHNHKLFKRLKGHTFAGRMTTEEKEMSKWIKDIGYHQSQLIWYEAMAWRQCYIVENINEYLNQDGGAAERSQNNDARRASSTSTTSLIL